MQVLKQALLFVLLCSSALAAAGFGAIEGDLRVLYWRNLSNSIRYAQELPAPLPVMGAAPPSTPQIAEPIYAYGWGGGIGYTAPGGEMGASIDIASLALTAKDRADAPPTPGQLLPVFEEATPMPISFATINWKMVYRHADGVIRVRVPLRMSGADLLVVGGVRYARIRFDEKIFYGGVLPGDSFNVRQRHSFEGIGPRIGCQLYWRILDGFSVDAKVGASGVAGTQRLSIMAPSFTQFGLFFNVDGNQDYGGEFIVAPAMDFAFSGGYRFDLRQLWLAIHIGYELNYYFGVDRRVQSQPRQTARPVRQNVGYGGPFLSIRGGF